MVRIVSKVEHQIDCQKCGAKVGVVSLLTALQDTEQVQFSEC